jgi:hypothetical protein
MALENSYFGSRRIFEDCLSLTFMAGSLRVWSRAPVEITIASGPTQIAIRSRAGVVEWTPNGGRPRASPLGTAPEKLRSRAQRFGEEALANSRRLLDEDLDAYARGAPERYKQRLDDELSEYQATRSPRPPAGWGVSPANSDGEDPADEDRD